MSACSVCVPRVADKPFYVEVESLRVAGHRASVHTCASGQFTITKIVSWHASRNAARRAVVAMRKRGERHNRVYVGAL